MTERPILFSGPMVRAILEGRKTQTRRVVKPQPQPNGGIGLAPVKPYFTSVGTWTWVLASTGMGDGTSGFLCPYGVPGDRLWVRETHRMTDLGHGPCVEYQAGGEVLGVLRQDLVDIHEWDGKKWRPSIHMPRWASRITLEITGVRVERLQEISDEDARAEGITDGGCLNCGNPEPCECANPKPDARDAFAYLWSTIHAADGQNGWAANPWVWVIEFKRLEVSGD